MQSKKLGCGCDYSYYMKNLLQSVAEKKKKTKETTHLFAYKTYKETLFI